MASKRFNPKPPPRITAPALRSRKNSPNKISALTAYDYTMARLIDSAGIDVVLVGDSLGTVIQGHATTIPVTLDEMVYHCRCVSRAIEHALLVGDLPFMSYQSSIERALESAGRLLKEGGVAAVKLEGGVHMAATISALSAVDIPVMGHVGLTPQSYHRMGGNKMQGKGSGDFAGSRDRVLEDALAVEQAGAFAVVVEGVPAELAAQITESLSIPTIGIGSGAGCDGQILVAQDMLGMIPEFSPRFVKRFGEFGAAIIEAVRGYKHEVELGTFPAAQHSVSEGEAVKSFPIGVRARRN